MKDSNLIKSIYRFITPIFFRRKKAQINNYLIWNLRRIKFRKEILSRYEGVGRPEITNEKLEILDYLKKNKLRMLSYFFPDEYKISSIKVYDDENNKLKYVLFDDKKLYFKRSWSVRQIKKYYRNLLAEQDNRSPHKYLTNNFSVEKGSIVVDAGAAEGIFSLMIIKEVSKIYLFEPDLEWIEALNATFKPWNSIVEIISLYLGDITDEKSITLDHFLGSNLTVNFIKADIEGYEQKLLLGAKKIMEINQSIKIAICTYHKQNDEQQLGDLLRLDGFSVNFSYGYVMFYYDSEIDTPDFRRCLIRAYKA